MGNGIINPKLSNEFHETYKLQEELGFGAFSVVKSGVHLKTGKQVAVKIIDKTKLSDDDSMMLAVEIQVLTSLNHPNVIK